MPKATKSAATSEGGAQTIAGIERALDVLSLFAEAKTHDLGVTEIASSLGLSKAVVHRILASFRAKGFVQVDEQARRYSLGPKVLFLGLAYLDRLDIRTVARQVMAELSREVDETATVSLRVGQTRVYVDQITPDHDIVMRVSLGTPYPLHAGASGKAFLAFLPPEEIQSYFETAALDKLTPATITDPRKLRRELERIRQRGYAISRGERMAAAASVAAPLFGMNDHRPLAVVSLCGPLDRFVKKAERAGELLLAATTAASLQMGHRSAPQAATN